ncbi:MAG: hypothetical protein MK198_12690 [Gracilimonas sp.]|uniref:hypothetical protein n=1 Tax=Gracilimonas sp. TaxID=1974203 RepID=UPI003753A82A|nr:hypothetical protein [Gracilimonas sp.]
MTNVRFIPQIGGQPTFINFGRPDPNQDLAVVIWGGTKGKWQQSPENIYPNNEICVTGRIESHERTPLIEAVRTEQIRIK